MYESTPQHLIDEESHPGILAEMLNSSSSSDTSSPNDSDSESSSGSHTTANRIKRALRRKRRKSTASSKDTSSLPSHNRSASSNTNSNSIRSTIPRTESPVQISPSVASHHETFLSGDEADIDGVQPGRRRDTRTSGVVCRDFENDRRKKKSKRSSKKSKKSKSKNEREAEAETEDKVGPTPATDETTGGPSHTPQVAFAADPPEILDSGPSGSKRPFTLRAISSHVKPSTVFIHHEATGRSLPYPVSRTVPIPVQGTGGLRRATSLPEMLRSATASPRLPPSAQPLPHLMPSSQPQAPVTVKEEEEPKKHLPQTSAIILLLLSTGLVAICAEFLVDSIDYLVSTSGVSQAFIGLIILPIVGNAAEHVTAVTVATKNKMDLAINVALGSSIQIALFVTPIIVLLGWILGREMSLYFSLFETISLFASAFIVNYLMIDGRSNYLEGALLMAAYVIIAVAAFFYPNCGSAIVSGLGAASQQC